jgi:excisionase family DNA binding protein
VTVRRWIASGELAASKAGPRRWLIKRSDVEAFLTAGAATQAADVSEDPSFHKHVVPPK